MVQFLPKVELTNILVLRDFKFEKISAITKAIVLVNPGVTLDGLIIKSSRPKPIISRIKIAYVIIYLINN